MSRVLESGRALKYGNTFDTAPRVSCLRGPKLRADLIHQTIEMGVDPMVVCKDPLARTYHHFTESEHELLCLADGRRSIEEIANELKRRYPSSLIQAEALFRFFQQAAEQGLLESPNGIRQCTSKRPWSILSLFAIRFPGVNPTRLLQKLSPLADVLFARSTIIASMIAAQICFLIVVFQFDGFVSDFTSIAENPFRSMVWIAIGITLSKVFHELAHALACRYLQCECPTVGVMLLFGIPCLYADVSDAWMLKRPRNRMLISAAGIYVECWIAVLATIVWVTSNTGPVHDLAITLMVVCSVSTLLINGNPLLRYDGYYLLSDATGVANLASRSRSSLFARVKSAFGNSASTVEPIWMSVYAFASWVYRCIVLLSVSAIIYRTLQVYDLDLLGTVMLATVFTIAIVKYAASLQQTRTPRLVLAAGILIAVIVLPIPRSVIAPMIVTPAKSHGIYAVEPGFLERKPEFGKQHHPMDVVSILSNPEMLRQHAEASANRDQVETQLKTMQLARGNQSQASTMIPTLERDLEHANAMVDFHQKSLQRLRVTANEVGTLYPPMCIASDPDSSTERLLSETGAWIPKGTPIGMLGDGQRREVVLYLHDREISKIQLHQTVSLTIRDAAKDSIRGKVISIDASPCEQFPASLLKTHLLSTTSESIFRIRVQLDASGDGLTVHRVGHAKVDTASESIARRFYRLLSETFG